MYKAIKGYEGIYEVNESGQVRSVDRMTKCKGGGVRKREGKELKLQKNHYGYGTVLLSKNGVAKTFQVHRIVAETFLPNPENLPEVHHKNHIRNDNRAENLQWVSKAEQYDDHWKARRGTSFRVVGNGVDKIYNSSMELQRELGINQSYAFQIAKGKYKQTKGYRIFYADKEI